MTAFDVIAGLILFVSAAVGFARGALREVVTVTAFVLAAGLAVFGLRFSRPLFEIFIEIEWLATVAAVVVVFVVAYLALRMVGGHLTQRVHDSTHLGMLDRSLGLGLGLIRALVVVGAFNLAFHAATPEDRTPQWVLKSTLWPLSEGAGKMLKILAPKGGAMAGVFAKCHFPFL